MIPVLGLLGADVAITLKGLMEFNEEILVLAALYFLPLGELIFHYFLILLPAISPL
jgi:hypothetical protein